MGAQFNIKSSEVRELASEVAQRMGVNMTEAVRLALRAQLKHLTRDERLARVRELTEGLRDRWPKDFVFEAHADFLYDENGLPK
jgi:hypothetical protein